MISNAGTDIINGEYRWFLQTKQWCNFKKSYNSKSILKNTFNILYPNIESSFCLQDNVDVTTVYNQIKHCNWKLDWKDNIKYCWCIKDIDGKIYYASPKSSNNSTIPTNNWYCIDGFKPYPSLTIHTEHELANQANIDIPYINEKQNNSDDNEIPHNSTLNTNNDINADDNDSDISNLDDY